MGILFIEVTFVRDKSNLQIQTNNFTAYTTLMDMDAKIVVNPGGLAGRNTTFSLILDERKKGEVSGYPKEFGVEPGHHTARLEYAFIKSNTVAFDVKTGSEIKLTWSISLKVILVAIVLAFLSTILIVLPYNPTILMIAGVSFMLLTPIIMLFVALAPGMIYKLKME